MKYIETFKSFGLILENKNNKSILLIVDVQRSFKKFFNEMYLNELMKYCNNFSEVYQIFDNHVDGKNVDKDYLYDENPDIPVHEDLYTFPNQVDIIEKRYRYNINIDYFKNRIEHEKFKEIKSLEDSNSLKIGDKFEINDGIFIFFIGNNHRWFECPIKLYDILSDLVNKEVTIVGGADSECLEDIFISAQSLGVKIKRDWKYIYNATTCPINH